MTSAAITKEGPAMKTVPLIMLPALGADSRLWQPVIDELKGEFDCTVIRGEGRTIQAMADHVLCLAPEEFVLVGISMGGYVALEVALRNTGRVKALVLFNTSAIAAPEDRRENSRNLVSLVESGGFQQAISRTAPAVSRGIPAVLNVVETMTRDLGERVFVDQQLAVLDRNDRRDDLAGLNCPALVVGAAEDTITPPELGEDLATGLPDARFVVIEKSGHFLPLEQPRATAAALRAFLQDHSQQISKGSQP
ncbi:alpha/beta hydrolase (plasmid) [Arthrobacter sp. D3-18]